MAIQDRQESPAELDETVSRDRKESQHRAVVQWIQSWSRARRERLEVKESKESWVPKVTVEKWDLQVPLDWLVALALRGGG